MITLGLTGGFHFGSCDTTATLFKNGSVIVSIEEERLTRIKYSYGKPPTMSVRECLDFAGITMQEVDHVVLYVTYPDVKRELKEHFIQLFGYCPPVKCVDHHCSHAASSYYASGFEDAAVVVFDWSGDGVSSSIWKAAKGKLEKIEDVKRPNSLGIFYAAFTQFLGFDRGDEYKVMGLAGYGEPVYSLDDFLDVSNEIYSFNSSLINLKNRSLYQLVFNEKFTKLKPELRRTPWQKITQEHMDLAASVQSYFERAAENYIRRAKRLTGLSKLCLAGGAGLNCKLNGKIVSKKIFDEVFLPPFPNDTGCSYGAAAYFLAEKGINVDAINSAQLGPSYSNDAIRKVLETLKIKADFIENYEEYIAKEINKGKLIGWFQGGMEVGPRALGGRSILANPLDRASWDKINKEVKFRDSFQPFAPSILENSASKYFDFDQKSPFMSFTAKVKDPEALPAVTHVDGTARLHTVNQRNASLFNLLTALENETGVGAVLNTSFNYKGQPIVSNPREAIYTFYGTGLDFLVLGNWVLSK